jgi:peptidoglycan/xylan/chitin deacetylase (PgdA/CDA1 family)
MPRACIVLAALVSMLGCSDAGGPSPQAAPKGEGIVTVSLTFDDTNANQWDASRVMERFDMLGTFYVNSPRIGQSNRLTEDQLHAMEAHGHEIGGHTLSHPDLTTKSGDELRREVCDDAQALRDLGFDISSFAYPFGRFDDEVIDVIRSCYRNARDTGSFNGGVIAESIPPENPYVIRAPSSVNNTPVPELKAYIEAARDGGGGWVPLTFHHVTDDAVSYRITPADFEAFLRWLSDERDAGRVMIETVRDVMTP